MKFHKLMSISAAALAAALLATPPAIAQTQLEDSVASGLASLGIDTEGLGALSTEQITQIQGVLNSTDDDNEKADRIERIVAMDDGPATGLGVAMLADSVAADLAALGIDTEGMDSLSLTQLSQIEGVTSSTDPDDTKRMRIERIMAGEMEMEGMAAGTDSMMLQDSVAAEVSKLGVDTSGLSGLSVAQLSEIENIVSSGDDEGEMRDRIGRVMAE